MFIISIILFLFALASQWIAYTPRRKKERHQKRFNLGQQFRKERRGVGVFNLIVVALVLFCTSLLLEGQLRLIGFISSLSLLLLFDSAVTWTKWKKHPHYPLPHLVDLASEANFFKIYPEGARANQYILVRHTAVITINDLESVANYNQKLVNLLELSRLVEKVHSTNSQAQDAYIQKEAEKAMEHLRNEIRYQQNVWLQTYKDLMESPDSKVKMKTPVEDLKLHLQKQGRLLEDETPQPSKAPELIGVKDLERIILDEGASEDVRAYALSTLEELNRSKEAESKERNEEAKRMDSISVIEAVRATHGLERGKIHEEEEGRYQ